MVQSSPADGSSHKQQIDDVVSAFFRCCCAMTRQVLKNRSHRQPSEINVTDIVARSMKKIFFVELMGYVRMFEEDLKKPQEEWTAEESARIYRRMALCFDEMASELARCKGRPRKQERGLINRLMVENRHLVSAHPRGRPKKWTWPDRDLALRVICNEKAAAKAKHGTITNLEAIVRVLLRKRPNSSRHVLIETLGLKQFVKRLSDKPRSK